MKKRVICILLAAVLSVSLCAVPANAAESASANEKEMFEYLTSTMGLNTAAACGILANAYYETGFRADLTVGSYYGLFMYYAPLGNSLKTWCANNGADYTTVNGQMQFLYAMFRGEVTSFSYKDLFATLNGIDNSAEGAYNAGSIFCYQFEKPGNADYEANKRGTYARDTLYPKYANTVTGSAVSEQSAATAVSFTGYVTASSLNVRSGPGTSYDVNTVIYRNSSVTVTAQRQSSSGSTWYQLSGGGWVSASYVTQSQTTAGTSGSDSTASSSSTAYTVTASALNVRSGAGTGNSVLRCVYNGETVYVTETSSDGYGTTWAHLSDGGWVSKSYLSATGSTSSSGTGSASYVVTASALNVRSGAGTGCSVTNCLPKGTVVTICDTSSDSSGSSWGKLSSGGWVCMTYLSAK